MSKHSRSGGKFTGSHTTCIPAASVVVDIANKCEYVTKIALGYIKAGLKSVGGNRRAKITDDGKSILISVRDNTSHQELRIFVSNLTKAKLILTEEIQATGIQVTSSPKSIR
jgi:hypothetical protein